jgi:hypothetical protein
MSYLGSSGGVITRPEALALGVPSSTLKEWVRSGRLVRVGTGIYVLPGVLEHERTTLQAATRALAAVVSHESAARMHGLDGLDPRRLAVTVPVRRSNRFAGVTVHQSTDLAEGETTTVEGIPTTDPPRTIVDLAAVLPPRLLASVLDQTVRRGLASYRIVAQRLEATARKGKPGVVKLRRVLEPRLGGAHVSDSSLETLALETIRDAGLPTPETQHRPSWLRKMNGRVDLAYVDQQIVVECDGQRWHGSVEAFQLDRERDNLAQLAGWIVLRFTWDDITRRAPYVVGAIRDALSRRSRDDISSLEH